MTRRKFLQKSIVLGCSFVMPSWAREHTKRLRMYNIHTGEHLHALFWEDGRYIQEELQRIEYFLRDFRTDRCHTIDTNLLEYLYKVANLVDAKEVLVISGYRAPQTNRYLRAHSTGVAKRSYHMQGKAIDFRLPHIPLWQVRNAALSIKRGGVGYYPKSNFLHIDTGNPRYWRFPKHV